MRALSRETVFFLFSFLKSVLSEKQRRSVPPSTVHQLDKCWVQKHFFSSNIFFNSVPFEKQALRDFRRSVLLSTVHPLDKSGVQKRFFFFIFGGTTFEFCKYNPT